MVRRPLQKIIEPLAGGLESSKANALIAKDMVTRLLIAK